MSEFLFLGIDTSNYTTSVTAMYEDRIIFKKTPVAVRQGEKGVRQSEAVFWHIKNLPSLLSEVFDEVHTLCKNDFTIGAVGVSSSPRSVDGSYMPCFLSGVTSASSIAYAVNCPLYSFSHQEGHIRAAVLGSGMDSSVSHFYCFHLSGGTCELLEVFKDNGRYSVTIVSDSADITLGQLIDRVGVAMHLDFPCGAQMEKLASESLINFNVHIKKSQHINLSGFENKALNLLHEGKTKEEVSSFVLKVCLEAVEVMLCNRSDKALPVLFSGGVSSNSLIRRYVCAHYDAYFAPPVYSADNSIGIAALARDNFLLR